LSSSWIRFGTMREGAIMGPRATDRRKRLSRVESIRHWWGHRSPPAGSTMILFDHVAPPTPRYGHGKPPHPELFAIIEAGRPRYASHLEDMLQWSVQIASVAYEDADSRNPFWNNGFLPGLDALALYSMLRTTEPSQFVEIGSGTSTKFARRAICDGNLRTQITSIDPHPRAEIDSLCDRVIRGGLEDTDLRILYDLKAGDIVFLDGSHRVLMNSDVTVFWLEVLPRLQPGVMVHIHDVYLPYDYPPEWAGRWYSEQYMLATQMLFGGGSLEVVLPNAFISRDRDLPTPWTNFGQCRNSTRWSGTALHFGSV